MAEEFQNKNVGYVALAIGLSVLLLGLLGLYTTF
jgi:hypothetical protein